MTDRHLNLFWSYRNHDLEDNVTRALMVTLGELSVAHQRLFVREVLLPEGREDLKRRIDENLTARSALQFDLQSQSTPSEGGEDDDALLTDATGILVGLHAGPESDIDLSNARYPEGEARVDAVIDDPEAGLTSILEVKLGQRLNTEQLKRHQARFFDLERGTAKNIFAEVTWTEVVDFLDSLAAQNVGDREAFVLEQFISYADMLGLSPFTGFRHQHFEHRASHPLTRYVRAIEQNVKTKPALKPHEGGRKRIDLEGIDPNFWIDYEDDGIRIGLVCGADTKHRAAGYRDIIIDQTEEFRSIATQLSDRAAEVDGRIKTALRCHARCFGTYFRTKWITNVEGQIGVPGELEKARGLFANRRLNPHTRISREEITNQFQPWLAQFDEDEFGEDGRFPKWADLDEKGFLVTLYFDLNCVLPREMLANKGRKRTLDLSRPIVEALAETGRKLYDLRKS